MPGTIDHANLTLKLDALQLSALDLGSATFPILLDLSTRLSNGTGANQASQVWSDTRTLGPSATENLDLSGAFTNAFGVSVAFTKIKAIIIRAASGNTNNVNVQTGATNGTPVFLAASDGLAVRPGGVFLLTAPDVNGITVTSGTGDILTITNSAGTTSVTYDVVVIGTD